MKQQAYDKIKVITVTVGDVQKSLPFGFTDIENCAFAQAAKRQIKNVIDVGYTCIIVEHNNNTRNTVIIDEGYWSDDYEADKKYLADNPTADPEEILYSFEVINIY
jgi:hypothetical protein